MMNQNPADISIIPRVRTQTASKISFDRISLPIHLCPNDEMPELPCSDECKEKKTKAQVGSRRTQAMAAAIEHLLSQQATDGRWHGEMVWSPTLTACCVLTHHLLNHPFPDDEREDLLRYFDFWQRADGSWGLHAVSSGYMYATALCYVAQRFLGRPPGHRGCIRSLKWIQEHGGIGTLPTWGKFWLALCNLYDWQGLDPMPPEIWLLPAALPFHPSKWYCHTRQTYLAMSVLYALRFQGPYTPQITDLRRELFADGYATFPFARFRNDIAETDLYVPPGLILRTLRQTLRRYEPLHLKPLRHLSIERLAEHLRYEQRQTGQAALSPVSGLLNALALSALNARPEEISAALCGMDYWRWRDAEQGLRWSGALSHTWDTAFALQALCAARPVPEMRVVLRNAAMRLSSFQILNENPAHADYYRSNVYGGFCFSDERHRWPVSDCAAEALTALLQVAKWSGPVLSAPQVRAAVDFILSRQNADGGFSSYEEQRGGSWLSSLNPSEMFDDCMIDRSYNECTGSCLRALLAALQSGLLETSRSRVQWAAKRAQQFLLSRQNANGSWSGAWGVNFIYGTFHAVFALHAAGLEKNHAALSNAHKWLVQHQRQDGGFGESWTSCVDRRYRSAPVSHPVQTAWALMAMQATQAHPDASIKRALHWLLSHQRADGSFEQGEPTGVFMNTSLLYYRMYPSYFPLWAMAGADA